MPDVEISDDVTECFPLPPAIGFSISAMSGENVFLYHPASLPWIFVQWLSFLLQSQIRAKLRIGVAVLQTMDRQL